MRLPILLLSGGLWLFPCSAPLVAQQGQGEFLVAAAANTMTNTIGGLFLVNPLAGTVQSLNATGALAYSYSLHCDPYADAIVWVGTSRATSASAPAIYQVTAAGGRILQSTPLNVALTNADETVWQVQVLGHQLMFLTSTQLSLVPLAGGTPKVLLKFDASNLATAFACDGRNLFVHMQPVNTLLVEHVYHYDLEQLQQRTLIYQSASLTHMISSVNLDGQGNLLIAEHEVFSGIAELRHIGPSGTPLRMLRLPFTYGTAGVRMDPGSSTLVVAGRRFDTNQNRVVTGFITYLNWQVFKSEFGASPEFYGQIAARRHLGIERYGHVCQATPGWRAEIGASGSPMRGNAAYSVNLRGRAGRPVVLLFGIHGPMTTPLSLSIMGAGTCELGVQEIAAFGFTLDNAGALTVPMPIPSAIAAVNVDVQFLVGDPAANAAGFVSSQVGSIVVR